MESDFTKKAPAAIEQENSRCAVDVNAQAQCTLLACVATLGRCRCFDTFTFSCCYAVAMADYFRFGVGHLCASIGMAQ